MCESILPAETTRSHEGSFIISCNLIVNVIIFIRVVLSYEIIFCIVIMINLYLGFPFSLVRKITVGPKLDCSTLRKSCLRICLHLNLKFRAVIILVGQMMNKQCKEF